ncbi:hypothetical protein BAE44_0018729 [Dichanthelium oligosanthes]|uniref:MATH domain-containing protein n=1 Tax=Dichanthelium oligosanthes TaxID=888268 RepID=A0A1E5V525_9POAL|nr:hypothetical protein BAE44_0018729 [Dichanthelium oligosanthes]
MIIPSDPTMSSSITPSPSNSCRGFAYLRARQLTGTHLLRIDGYSTADRMVPGGEAIESRTFSAGRRKWQLSYYPNGHKQFERGPASVKLELKDSSGSRDDLVVAASTARGTRRTVTAWGRSASTRGPSSIATTSTSWPRRSSGGRRCGSWRTTASASGATSP